MRADYKLGYQVPLSSLQDIAPTSDRRPGRPEVFTHYVLTGYGEKGMSLGTATLSSSVVLVPRLARTVIILSGASVSSICWANGSKNFNSRPRSQRYGGTKCVTFIAANLL